VRITEDKKYSESLMKDVLKVEFEEDIKKGAKTWSEIGRNKNQTMAGCIIGWRNMAKL
jgi:hypothetical protein